MLKMQCLLQKRMGTRIPYSAIKPPIPGPIIKPSTNGGRNIAHRFWPFLEQM